MTTIPIKRALLSVSDKAGLLEFAKSLNELGIELLSTGGTSQTLRAGNIPHQQVDDLTQWPEMLGGRVKTLHPMVHGGILAKRDQHADEMQQFGIPAIDLVVVNFYPFEKTIAKEGVTLAQAIEMIDVGGPTMVRAAAKNMDWVTVATDPNDYPQLIDEIKHQGGIMQATRQRLARQAFARTSQYDAMINAYLSQQQADADAAPVNLSLHLEKQMDLRYGENPHQKASLYQCKGQTGGVASVAPLQGKPLSYNNLLDTDAAWQCVNEFTEPACVIVKHANPCGAATAQTIDEAYQHAYQADTLSAFGGIVALNRPCTRAIAEAITSIFMEVVVAPDFSPEALTVFASKPNLRVLQLNQNHLSEWEWRFISGGMLMQERDRTMLTSHDLQIVTEAQPDETAVHSMLFAWRVLKHIKSNGILLAKTNATVGVGAGQVSRVDAVELALKKAGDQVQDCVLASDAFFPFRDSIDKLAGKGIRAIIQPGGSMRDAEVIAACNEYGIAMVFTGQRCFRH
jgi:phosphoribosylaminoimidazolecarboxamide formyltransferase/IMP cyclohydrolase